MIQPLVAAIIRSRSSRGNARSAEALGPQEPGGGLVVSFVHQVRIGSKLGVALLRLEDGRGAEHVEQICSFPVGGGADPLAFTWSAPVTSPVPLVGQPPAVRF